MNVAALIVGRKGSSMERKNMRPLLSHPVAWWAMQAVKAADLVTHRYVSTDDGDLAELAIAEGFARIPRKPEHATDDSPIVDTLRDVMQSPTNAIDILVVVAANCATHHAGVIDCCIEAVKSGADSAVTGHVDNDRHPWRVKALLDGNHLAPWCDVPQNASSNRQALPPSVMLDHSVWALDTRDGLKTDGQPPWPFMGNRIAYVENPGCVDIHTEEDLAASERWILSHVCAGAAL